MIRNVYADCPRHGRVVAEATFADEPVGPKGDAALLELRCLQCVEALAANGMVPLARKSMAPRRKARSPGSSPFMFRVKIWYRHGLRVRTLRRCESDLESVSMMIEMIAESGFSVGEHDVMPEHVIGFVVRKKGSYRGR